MGDYKIESGIPIPTDFRQSGLKYPFDEMNVGDSLFIPPKSEEENVKQLGNRIAQARQAYQKRMAKRREEVRFTQRMWTEDEVASYRIWRVT